MATKKKVLFVCLGNICRSPMAEAVFLNLLKEKGIEHIWQVDSAAIGGWHIGSKPDKRALCTLARHKVPYNNTARQICHEDFLTYNFIFGMDENNIQALIDESQSVPNAKSQILLLGDYDPEGERIIRDPYYDNDSRGFEKCYEQCVRCCTAFLEKQMEI